MTLVAIGALAVTGLVTALVIFIGQLPSGENVEFVWRRQLDDPPLLAAGVPIVFALFTLLLITLFRKENRLQGLIVALIVIVLLSAVYLPSGACCSRSCSRKRFRG